MIAGLTEGEFLRYSKRFRHKKAAELLRAYHERGDQRVLLLYRRVEAWLQLPILNLKTAVGDDKLTQDFDSESLPTRDPFTIWECEPPVGSDSESKSCVNLPSPTAVFRLNERCFEQLSDRYHFHLAQSGFAWKEHNLLAPSFRRSDQPSSVPHLPVSIYLDNLRSAFNVGSILRTVEAFRLGSVYFAKNTPFIDNPKVQKTSMYTYDKVPCFGDTPLSELPHPLIALETDDEAPSVFDFAFPRSFTLMLGNEEYGLSEEVLSLRTHTLRIPLFGFKNSLNVASAFAIAAGIISHQLRNKTIDSVEPKNGSSRWQSDARL